MRPKKLEVFSEIREELKEGHDFEALAYVAEESTRTIVEMTS